MPVGHANPPAPTDMLKTINQYWVDEEFSNIEPYIGKILADYPNYLPADIADAIQAYKKGAQSEALVSKIEKIIVKISRHLPEVPPNCFDFLEEKRDQHKKFVKFFKKVGLTKSQRLEKYNPSKMPPKKRAPRWFFGYGHLFQGCPATIFPNSRLEPATKFHKDKINPKVEKLEVGELKQVIFDNNQPEGLRLSAVTLYAKKANNEEIMALLDCIELYNLKLAQKCAYELSGVSEKEEIISRLLEKANKPSSKYTRRYSLWALIRLDSKDNRILKKTKEIALGKKIGQEKWLRDTYTQRVLGYLEQRNGG